MFRSRPPGSPGSAGAARFWNLDNQVALLSALTLSFLWVGSYGYRYNVTFLNAEGLNYHTFGLWVLGICAVLRLYRSAARRWKPWPVALLITWMIYFPVLFGFEYLFYHILQVREISKPARTALLFDTIHGTTALHWFYLTVPLTAVGCFTLLRRFLSGIRLPVVPAEQATSISVGAVSSRRATTPLQRGPA